MHILVIGSGGREHAIIKALCRDARIKRLFALPGNDGMEEATCIPGDPMDSTAVLAAAQMHKIDFCIVTPDDPLANGLVDALEAGGIACFGPTKEAARIESSKVFAKELMGRHHIPTAAWHAANTVESGLAIALAMGTPLVIKVDGLAKGKGVFILNDQAQVEPTLQAIFRDRVFGQAADCVVIEECLQGPEISVLVLTDGEHLLEMPSAMDHKRAFDGDCGPNTGGMGAIAPNPYYTPDIAEQCREKIYWPTLRAMSQEGRIFRGCLYFGIMLTQEGPKVLEYNARFGDPETQAILMLLNGSPLDAFLSTRNGGLRETDLSFYAGSACCIVLASGGYPGSYKTGLPIRSDVKEGLVCFAGVQGVRGQLVTAGGRVAAACVRADTLQEAIAGAYRTADSIWFEGRQMRRDIGQSVLNQEGFS